MAVVKKNKDPLETERSYKLYYDFNDLQLEIIDELTFHTTNLYNQINYDMRQNGHGSYYDNTKVYANNWHKNYITANCFGQVLIVLEQNWKSYFVSIKDYKLDPNKYTGKPRQPGFKNLKNNRNEIIFTKNVIRGAKYNCILKNNLLRLTLSKDMQTKFGVGFLGFNMKNVKLPNDFDFDKIQQVKIAFDRKLKKYYLNFLYRIKKKENVILGTSIMSIDLGMNNLETITFDKNKDTFIIDGKILKSKQSYINKRLSIIQSEEMKKLKDSSKYRDTKKARQYREYYNNFVKDYMHKCSRQTIDLALKYNCGTIIIGDFKGVKRRSKAKLFVKIPYTKLLEYIKYKADFYGIKIVMQNEAYTSGCSVLDNEVVGKNTYDKTRRKYRGLFVTKKGVSINADVNGSYNIMKKYFSGIDNKMRKEDIKVQIEKLKQQNLPEKEYKALEKELKKNLKSIRYFKTNPECLVDVILRNRNRHPKTMGSTGNMTSPGMSAKRPFRIRYSQKIK